MCVPLALKKKGRATLPKGEKRREKRRARETSQWVIYRNVPPWVRLILTVVNPLCYYLLLSKENSLCNILSVTFKPLEENEKKKKTLLGLYVKKLSMS